MFNRKALNESEYDDAITKALIELDRHKTDTEMYGKILDRIVKLQKMRAEDARKPVSKDTLVTAATNILGIILITQHEHTNVITSKALGFVQKLR